MTAEARSLLAAVLALPEDERSLLVEEFLEVRPPQSDDLASGSLEAELDRRFEEYQQDHSTAIPWSEIKRAK